jgi:hypothetical protein
VIAFGSIASAAISASAETTSSQLAPLTSRGRLAFPRSSIVRRPTNRSPSSVTATRKVRASSRDCARRALAVRARTSLKNAASSAQPPTARTSVRIGSPGTSARATDGARTAATADAASHPFAPDPMEAL